MIQEFKNSLVRHGLTGVYVIRESRVLFDAEILKHLMLGGRHLLTKNGHIVDYVRCVCVLILAEPENECTPAVILAD